MYTFKTMTNASPPQTIPQIVDVGIPKNTTGIACAVKRGGVWHETSVEDFREKIEAFALGLYAMGIRQGDRVALHSENSTEWIIIDQAVLRLGAVTVPIYTTQPGDQIKYILEDAEARIYIVSTEALFEAPRPFIDEIETLETTVGILGSYADGMLTFDEVLEQGRKRRDAAPGLLATLQEAIAPDDLATLVYTSGTTGLPKGVMLTHGNLASNVLAVEDRFPFDPDEDRGGAMLSYLPLSHSLERTATLTYLYIGYPIYFVEDFREIAEDFKTVRPVHMSTVPRLLEKIHAGIHKRAGTLSGVKRLLMRWALGLAERYDVARPPSGLQHKLAERLVYKKLRDAIFGGNLKAVTSGGAALPGNLMNFFNALGLFCAQGYGLTETSPVITLYKKGTLRAGSAGIPVNNVEVRIADDGEILARGPNIMKGYYKLPDKTAEVMSDGGWFHTGDIGHLDDGHLFITDRKKQLFKLSTGKYIAPTPIEVALSGSPLIEQVVVVGSEYKFCAALIVLDPQAVRQELGQAEAALPDADLAADASVNSLIDGVVTTVNESLPHWEQVKKFCLLEQPFSIEGGELTPTLKVKRRVVHEKYRDRIEGMYG